MKKIDLGQTIAILANLGVIAGIGFLAFEINQNTRQLALTLEWQVNQRMVDNNRDFLTEDSRSLFAKSIMEPEELTFSEFSGAITFVFNFWNVWEDRYFLYESGLLTEADWKGFIADDIEAVMGNAFAQSLWQQSKQAYEPVFIDYVDFLLANVSSDATYQWYLDTLEGLHDSAIAN